MTTYTFFEDSAVNSVVGTDATYLTSRSGAGTLTLDLAASPHYVGQELSGGTYYCEEIFLAFDTSSIVDDETVTSVTLSLEVGLDGSTTDFTLQARLFNWGTTVTTADFVPGASLSGNQLLASVSSAGIAVGSYVALTSDAAFAANVNKTGVTRMVLSSDRMAAGTAPPNAEYLRIFLNRGDTGTNRPKLVVTTVPANVAPTIAVTSPADGASTTDDTPDFVFTVTDPDASQTLTVTVEIYSDVGLSTLVQTRTNTTSTPASSATVTVTATAITRSVSPYYWRAKVSDGTATSSWTTTRTLTIGWDSPTVTIGASTPATTISTGGPNITVTYTYAQTQSLAQASRRVRVQNAAGSTTYYDSGVVMSATTTLSIDAVAEGIPTDTTGTALKVVVDVVAATSTGAGTANKSFDIQWGVVTVTVTTPSNNSVIATTALTPAWSFASTRSKTQASYRFRLLQAGTGAVLYDSGYVTSAAASALLGYTLVDTGNYVLEVTAKNSEGVLSS